LDSDRSPDPPDPLEAPEWTEALESPRRERWLKPAQVSGLFVAAGLPEVPSSTLRAWAVAGKITSARTLGRHRRYPESEARALVERQLQAVKVAA
jgi:hypothetical protein